MRGSERISGETLITDSYWIWGNYLILRVGKSYEVYRTTFGGQERMDLISDFVNLPKTIEGALSEAMTHYAEHGSH